MAKLEGMLLEDKGHPVQVDRKKRYKVDVYE